MQLEQAPFIRISRLILRPYRLSDVDDLLEYRSHPEWARYTSLVQPYAREDAERDVREYAELDARSHAFWAIEIDGRAVGNIDADLESPWRSLLGWGIARQYWGQGLTAEAATAVIDWVFAHPEMTRAYATTDARNTGSRRVMEKVGMSLEATLRLHRRDLRGELADEVWYSLLRQDWQARC